MSNYTTLQLYKPTDPNKKKPINQPDPKPKTPGYDDNAEPKDGYRRPPMQV